MTTSKDPTRILLVRHGAAEGAEGVAVGQVDLPLSRQGAVSLERIAGTWRGPKPDHLLASDLARATGSARILGDAWGLEVSTDPRLREMDFGDWDGVSWADLQERDGERLRPWMKCWWSEPAPGGEGFSDVAERAGRWLDEMLAEKCGQTVVAVAHGGSIRTLLCRTLGLSIERAFHLQLDHGRASGLAIGRRGLEVAFMNADRFPAGSDPGLPPPGVARKSRNSRA